MHNDKFLYRNNGHGEGNENYCTLSFEYKFEYLEDEVWFAHAVPYTYTDMQDRLLQMKFNPEYNDILRQEVLCKSISGVPVPLLTITEGVRTYIESHERYRLQNNINSVLKKSYKQKYK